METLKETRTWSNVFQILKDYDEQPRKLYPGKLYDTIEGGKTLHDVKYLK